MNIQTLNDKFSSKGVLLVSSAWPQFAFHWRNPGFLRIFWVRIILAIVSGGLCMLCVQGVWHALTSNGWMPSHRQQWQHLAQAHSDQQSEQSLQMAKLQVLVLKHAQTTAALLEYQTQVDELILAWPNSALRMHLISHLQQMAQTQKLHISQMKLTPLSDEHGFEVAVLDFSLKGTQWATFAYWQAMNRLFQNGIWPALIWRLLPDGEYGLEGQVHLLWDAQDAFTDTGVELQDASRFKAEKSHRSLDAHVLPDHSLGQMRIVGTAQSFAGPKTELFWTFLQSGRQTSVVRAGQYLGIENRQVLSLDAQGLWLGGELGQPSTLLAWDKVPP